MFSPDGHTLASAGADRVIRLWDVDHGKERAILGGYGQPLSAMAFSADGRNLGTASLDGAVRIWHFDDGSWVVRTSPGGHSRPVPGLSIALSGPMLVNLRWDGLDKTWANLTDQVAAILHEEPHVIRAVALSPDCKLVGTAGDMGLIRIWDLGKGAIVTSWEGHVGVVTSLCFSPDGSTLASGGLDGTVRLWNLGKRLKGDQD